MKVCMLTEGSYPYIFGGVSSWISDLLHSFPAVQFVIVAIMPTGQTVREYSYTLPPNVVTVHTIFLDEFHRYDPLSATSEPAFSPKEALLFKQFIRFDKTMNWEQFFTLAADPLRIGNPINLLQSKFFWDMVVEFYQEAYSHESFNTFYWSMKSMFLYFISIIQWGLPDADIYHSVSTGYAGLLGMLAKLKYRKPFILTEHGISAREREEDILNASPLDARYRRLWIDFYYFIATLSYRSATQCISLFASNRKQQVDFGAKKTMIIPNGIDVATYNLPKQPHEGINIAAILRVVPIKDVKTLVRAYKIVTKEVPDTRLMIIGPYDEDPQYFDEVKRLIDYLELSDQVIFTGRVDLKAYLPKIDILVLTSISEVQPLALLEGSASSIPFVATDVGFCRELLEGGPEDTLGPSGIVVPPKSPLETADAIVTLCQDTLVRKQMGQAGLKRVQTFYEKEISINSYKEIYGVR